MYNNYFHLKGAPFSIAPDPRYLFMSERHREALAHLLYGIGSGGGFVLLTGEIGAGKTTVCRCFIEQIPDNCRLAYIFNPKLTVEELLQTICDEFRIAQPAAGQGGAQSGVKGYVDAINAYLLASHAEGNNNVLVIDEAQNLSPQVLEQLRLLTNLETSERKLLQIILIGQPELRTMLARPELEQLAQRVIARYHLGPLSAAETGAYVAHRLAVAGVQGSAPIPAALAPLIHRLTGGVPRRINLLCDRALLGAYVEGSRDVTPAILRRAAREVFTGEGSVPSASTASARTPLRWPMVAGGVLAGALGAVAWQTVPHGPAHTAPTPAAASVRPGGAAHAMTAAAPAAASPSASPSASASVRPLALATQEDALRELGTLWHQQLPAGEPCAGAPRLGLRCYAGRGGLYELRLLDRPAIVALHDGPRLGYAVLSNMDADHATLTINGQRQTVSLGALATRFDGSYTTLWKAPRDFREQVGAGAVGPDVDWAAARLAGLNASPAPRPGEPLEAPMQRALRAFQTKQNLKADGLIGPRTYMRLNQLSGVDEPRLLAAAGNGK